MICRLVHRIRGIRSGSLWLEMDFQLPPQVGDVVFFRSDFGGDTVESRYVMQHSVELQLPWIDEDSPDIEELIQAGWTDSRSTAKP